MTDVVVPTLGPSIEEAVFVKWHAAEGDRVQRGMPLYSVETDKTIVDIECPADGALAGIATAEGDTVRVDQVLAKIEAEASATAAASRAPQTAQHAAAPEVHARVATPAPPATVASASAAVATVDAPQTRANAAADSAPPARPGWPSPRARRLARELDVPVDRVRGTGPGGRILERDIATFVANAMRGGAPAIAPRPASASLEKVPLTGMRRTIAQRLTASVQQIPVFTATIKIACDALLATRAQLNRLPGYDVSVTDLLVRAAALALRRCPELNASFGGDHVVMHGRVDVAVAVALPQGLVTPVVRDADEKPIAALSAELGRLVERARSGRMPREEYEGGTFTISNLGMHGVESFTAIVDPPQCAILAVGAIDREVALDAGAVRERACLRATLSADHRIVDGAVGARFLGELRALLENPAALLV